MVYFECIPTRSNLLAERTCSSQVVSMTNGASTHNEALHQELLKPTAERDAARMARLGAEYAAVKEGEFRAACGFFGLEDVRVLGFRDKQFRKTDAAVNAVRLGVDVKVIQTPLIFYMGSG
jgi:LmbE family N-acetylglucosaminyl deacetylase